jgi:hypothetical protein
MHYRLGLFIIAIILYGICENTFNLWGEKLLHYFLSPDLINETISFFWLFMIVGQIIILIPLYFLSARNVFYFLVFLIILALFAFPFQTKYQGFLAMLTLAGSACAACFPILLAMMEEEIKEAKGEDEYHIKVLPFMEIGISWMMIGYIIGTGYITLKVEAVEKPSIETITNNFFIAIICAIVMFVIAYFLSSTFQLKLKRKNKWYNSFFR